MDYIYHDNEAPLRQYKNKVWYDDSKGIDELELLAFVLGFKSLTIFGDKDDESDIAVIKTNNRGTGLTLENCHLKIEIKDYFEKVAVRDGNGNKTYFNRGDKNVI